MEPEATSNGPVDGGISAGYSLLLEGEGIKVNKQIDQAAAFQILAILMGSGQTPPGAAGPAGDPGARSVAPMPASPGGYGEGPSLREYFDEVEPQRNVEKILAIANYLKLYQGYETFTREDVKKGFRQASEPLPGNYGRDFSWVLSTGWVAHTENRGEYYVTKTGGDVAAAKFPADARKSTGVAKTRRRRSTTKKEDDE